MNVCGGSALRFAIGANKTFTDIFLPAAAAAAGERIRDDVEGTIGMPIVVQIVVPIVVFFTVSVSVSVMEALLLPPCFFKSTVSTDDDGKNRAQQQTEIIHAVIDNSNQ